jgi:arsenite/tail-anchored protein-transporting ATPase
LGLSPIDAARAGVPGPLRQAVGDAAFVFVVGKGGVGKTTAAGALALELADAGLPTHLLSTDPAHSLADLFGQPAAPGPAAVRCTPQLLLEEFDADAFARTWIERTAGPVSQIVEAGTYLDADDVAGFTRLALPGVDEMMAVLRLVELTRAGRRVVVDTAPTGHTLRLLDAGDVHESIAAALRTMADKAAAVASGMARGVVRLSGESAIDEMEQHVETFRKQVLGRAAFVVVTRDGGVVAAETRRLLDALAHRGLDIAATVFVGAARPAAAAVPASAAPEPARQARPASASEGRRSRGPAAAVALAVPLLAELRGCAGLRAWRAAMRSASTGLGPAERSADSPSAGRSAQEEDDRAAGGTPRSGPPAVAAERPALPWLLQRTPRVLLFAGKGGVGKSTCAAAAALALAESRAALLCSADPAGSLDDVLGTTPVDGLAAPRLRVLQIDPQAHLDRLRDEYQAEVLEALERLGLSEAAHLDRRVIQALWDLAPPGIDEFAALAAMLQAAESSETVIIDAAPTGHFLRLLTLPAVALDWTRQLMRIIVKYRAAGVAGSAAESLLQAARELRSLQELLHDPARCGVVAVTLPDPMVAAETHRLVEALRSSDIPVAAILCNRSSSAGVTVPGVPLIRAPVCELPLVGAAALQEFVGTWMSVT